MVMVGLERAALHNECMEGTKRSRSRGGITRDLILAPKFNHLGPMMEDFSG